MERARPKAHKHTAAKTHDAIVKAEEQAAAGGDDRDEQHVKLWRWRVCRACQGVGAERQRRARPALPRRSRQHKHAEIPHREAARVLLVLAARRDRDGAAGHLGDVCCVCFGKKNVVTAVG